MKNGERLGDMKAEVMDFQTPNKAYSQGFESDTLNYINRQDSIMEKEAKELRSQDFRGRYSR